MIRCFSRPADGSISSYSSAHRICAAVSTSILRPSILLEPTSVEGTWPLTGSLAVRSLALVATLVIGAALRADEQALKIGIVDFYGLNKVSPGELRKLLAFKEGDTIRLAGEAPAVFRSSEERLTRVPGVVRVRFEPVCCDAGAVIVFVGIQEQGAPTLHVRPAPTGAERLPADIVRSGQEFSKAMMAAVQRGDAGEDRSLGHALMHDPAARASQERFVEFARRDRPLLRAVLRNSADAAERALAAQVVAYTADKQSVVDDLVRGMSDAAEEVRNNAMRALMVFAEARPGPNGSTLRIPAAPFIEFLHSLVWSDRNKASLALMALSTRRDPALLAELRQSALPPLAEMARWKSAGHALPAFLTLARVAGYPDDDANARWGRGDREVVIRAAIGKR
jgi:hypothetical protein